MNALDSIDASEYDVIWKRKLAESERLMRSDIDNQKTAEREKKKAVVQSRPSDKDTLVKTAVQRVMSVTEKFKVKDIIEFAKTLYDQGSYSITENKVFTRDVMNKLEGKKVQKKRKADKLSDDVLTQFLDNSKQSWFNGAPLLGAFLFII